VITRIFLGQRGLRLWPKDSPEALAARGRYKSDSSDESVLSDIKTAAPETAANAMLCLINQASYLLHRQLKRLEQDSLKIGGFTERLYATRTRTRNLPSDQSDLSVAALCPRCGKPMCQRTARKAPRASERFWGCTAYPEYKGTRPLSNQSESSD
jgi:restriction system protein